MWAEIGSKCRSTKRHLAAIAYLGNDAQHRLPLVKGDLLVVNGSDRSFQAGAVDPAGLEAYVAAGVEVVSSPTLHAKVLVLGNTAFVGSANNSQASESILIEAVLCSPDAEIVRAAREFIHDVAANGEAVDEEFLIRARKLWRPPKGGGGHEPRDPGPLTPVPTVPFRLFVVGVTDWKPSESDTKLIESVEPGVRRAVSNAYLTEVHYFDRSFLKSGDVVVLVSTDEDGSWFGPPQVVVHVETVKGRWPHDLVFVRYAKALDPRPVGDVPSRLLPAGELAQRVINKPDHRQELLGLWGLDDPGPP